MIRSFIEGKWYEFDNLYEALGINLEIQYVISLIGGGGKTTILRRLQKEYEMQGIPSIATTTTHFQTSDEKWFLGEPSMEKLKKILEKYGKVWAGELTNKGKLQSLPEPFLKEMITLGHTVFVEADGARRLPCKAPGPCEPVYVEETNIVLSVYGMDAIGKRIKDTCFRPELVAEILEKKEEDVITPRDIPLLAADIRGGRKLIKNNMDYQVILNKADSKEEVETAEVIAKELYVLGISRVHITSGLMNKEERK